MLSACISAVGRSEELEFGERLLALDSRRLPSRRAPLTSDSPLSCSQRVLLASEYVLPCEPCIQASFCGV